MVNILFQLFYGTLKRINVPESDGTPYFVNLEISKGLPVDTEIIHNCAHRRISEFICVTKIIIRYMFIF